MNGIGKFKTHFKTPSNFFYFLFVLWYLFLGLGFFSRFISLQISVVSGYGRSREKTLPLVPALAELPDFFTEQCLMSLLLPVQHHWVNLLSHLGIKEKYKKVEAWNFKLLSEALTVSFITPSAVRKRKTKKQTKKRPLERIVYFNTYFNTLKHWV